MTFLTDERMREVANSKLNECLRLVSAEAHLNVRLWVVSDLGAFGQFQSVFDIHAEVADGTFNLRMAEKNLNCA